MKIYNQAIVIVSILFCIFFHSMTLAKSTIKIGIVAFLSGGAASSFGIPHRNGYEFMFDAINNGSVPFPYNTPGIGGAKIEYFFVDEAGGATKQVTEYRNLVERQGVDIVMGYISSGDCLAIPPVAEELKKLTILSDCGTPRVFEENNYKYVFRTGPHAAMDNVSAARYIFKRGIKVETVAGINQNYAWGQDSWADFSMSLKSLYKDINIVSEQFPKIFAGQYGAEVSALSIAKPDVIHSSFWGSDLEAFVLQAQARRLFKNSTIIFSAGDHVLPSLGKNMPDGVIIGARGPHGDLAPDSPLGNWFKTNMAKRYNIKQTTQPMHKAAMAVLFVKKAYDLAFEKTGKFPNQEQVIEVMEGLEWDSPSGLVSMALGNGHQAIQDTAIGITKWDPDENRVKIIDIERFNAKCVNPPEGIKAIDWIAGGFKGAECN